MFRQGHFEKKTLYGPFRIVLTLMEIAALVYIIQVFISQDPKITSFVLIICLIMWIVTVIVQILLVHTILYKVDVRLESLEGDSLEGPVTMEINRKPRTWVNIIRLFLVMDVIFPGNPGK